MANRAIAMGDDTDGGFTDDEEAEQLAHVRAAAKRSAEHARSITESLSPRKPRRESPHGGWRGGSRDSRTRRTPARPPCETRTREASHDFDSPRGTPGRGIVARRLAVAGRVHADPPRRRPHSCLDRTAGPGAGTRRRRRGRRRRHGQRVGVRVRGELPATGRDRARGVPATRAAELELDGCLRRRRASFVGREVAGYPRDRLAARSRRCERRDADRVRTGRRERSGERSSGRMVRTPTRIRVSRRARANARR